MSARDETIVVGDLDSANLGDDLICVTESASLEQIETLFLLHDYSQLPVVHSKHRRVTASQRAVSWKSVARARLKEPTAVAKDAFRRAQVVQVTDDVIRVMPTVLRNDFVLVAKNGSLSGIVTPFDLTLFFGEKMRPFMLIGEIDKRLRRAIGAEFSLDELQAASGSPRYKIASADDLSIGNYIALLDSPDNWARLRWPLDRALVMAALHRVRVQRNQLMHFKEKSDVDTDEILHVLDVIRDFTPNRPEVG